MSRTEPFSFLKGERISLCAFTQEYIGEEYLRWMNDPEINQYLETRFYPHSLESLRSFVASMTGSQNNVFLAIVVNATGKHIGNIKLGNIQWIHRIAEIGLVIGEKEHWGQGYATEAIRLISRHAFETLGLYKLTAGFYANNLGSIKAFKTAGFQEEGLVKAGYFLKGKRVDGIIMGKETEF